MLKTPIGRLRAIGLLEGVSFLVLLFIAMPLKYFAGMPMAVRVVGWGHGLLFMLYILALGQAAEAHRWSLMRVVTTFVASLLPFGTFAIDGRLRREEQAAAEPTSP